MSLLSRRSIHTVTVEPFTGDTARGPVYGTAVTVRCRVQEAADYRHGASVADRHETVPDTVIYAPLDADIPVRSRVTLPSGRVGIAVEVHRHTGLAHLQHLKVVVR